MNEVTCAACGTLASPDQRFCGNCGSALMSGCPTCGATNPPGQRFCGTCGTNLAGGVPAAGPALDDGTTGAADSR